MEAAGEVAELLERVRQLVRRRDEQRAASRARRAAVASASRRASEAETSRCCAPSWRLRSRRLRVSSAVAHDARARRAQLGLGALVRDRLRGQVGEAPQPDLAPAAKAAAPGRDAASAPRSDALMITGAAITERGPRSGDDSSERLAKPVSRTGSVAPPGVGVVERPGLAGVPLASVQPATTTTSSDALPAHERDRRRGEERADLGGDRVEHLGLRPPGGDERRDAP